MRARDQRRHAWSTVDTAVIFPLARTKDTLGNAKNVLELLTTAYLLLG